MTSFQTLPEGDYRLDGVALSRGLMGTGEGFAPGSISIKGGKIAAHDPALPGIEMKGAIALPLPVDMHCHLDKGQIWPRSPNPDGTFPGALGAVMGDRAARWNAEDLRARMDFSLRSAFAHGTGAIRTHLDSGFEQWKITYPVFEEMQAEWAGRIALQAVMLMGPDWLEPDGSGPMTEAAAAMAKIRGGNLGMFVYPMPDLAGRLLAFFRLAERLGLDVDLHVDETLDPTVNTLRLIAETVLAIGFQGKVSCGHLCSLTAMPRAEAEATLDLVAKARINAVSLPMCNLYLQDRHAGRTPLMRGITLVHEMKARGIPVIFASDNTRDPFYAYGDLDMLEVIREATRIGHLDHSDPSWITSFFTAPAEACGFEAPSLAPGAPADILLLKARSFTEMLARPQSDRIVLRNGAQIDTSLPDYSELDHLMRTA